MSGIRQWVQAGGRKPAATAFFAMGALLTLAAWRSAGLPSTLIPGDANLDGVADLGDIEAFALAIRGPEDWRSRYNATHATMLAVADMNGDGRVDSQDSDGFGRTIGANVVPFAVRAPAGPATLQDFPAGLIGGVNAEPPPPQIDLDIDSDNNQSTTGVARSPAEDAIEDAAPGKFILVNDDDDDRNGVPDLNQAGRIIGERDDLTPIVVDVTRDVTITNPPQAEGVSFRLNFPSSAMRVWRYADRGTTAPSTDEMTSGQARVARLLGDMDCNGAVTVNDIGPFVMAMTDAEGYRAAFPDCARTNGDMNLDSAITVGDIGQFVQAVSLDPAWTPRFAPQWLWVEALQPSSSGGDRTIIAEADFDNGGSFGDSDSVKVTAAVLGFAPTVVALGTPVAITLTPAIAPFTLNNAIDVTWNGTYTAGSSTTNAFSVAYSGAQLAVQSAGQASVLVGAGAFSSAPDPSSLISGGTLRGRWTLRFATANPLSRESPFLTLDAGAADWMEVDYPAGPGGAIPPQLGSPAVNLYVMPLSEGPLPSSPLQELLYSAASYHVAVRVRIKESPTGQSQVPATVSVKLTSRDSQGALLQVINSLTLFRVAQPDGDPEHVVYHNDLSRPLVLVDTALAQEVYPLVIPFQVTYGGSMSITPASP